MDIPPPKPFRPDTKDSTGETWKTWKQSFEVYLIAKGLEDASGRRKVNLLLHFLGTDGIKLYNTFEFTPAVEANEDNDIEAVPAEDNEDLVTVLRKFDRHYGHKKYRNIKRQAFLDRNQQEGENLMDFVADLKHRAKECEYGDAEASLLCDRIIQGVKSEHVKMRLLDLEEDELTLENCIRICRSSELTQQHLKILTKEDSTVHFTRGRHFRGSWRGRRENGNSRRADCERCNKFHDYGKCPAFHKFCGSCGDKGHFARSKMCRNPSQFSRGRGNHGNRRGGGRGRGQNRFRSVHAADYDDRESTNNAYEENVDIDNLFEQCTVHDVFTCESDKNTKSDDDWHVYMGVHGKALKLEIDSGAKCNVLSLKTLRELHLDETIEPSNVLINGVHGKPLKAYGKVKLECTYKGKCRKVEFQVLDDSQRVDILGRQECVMFGLIVRVHNVACSPKCEKLLSDYKDVFDDTIGCIPGTYHIKLDENVKPVIHSARPVPAPIRDQVKAELDHLEACGVITKVTEPTEWVSPMVCVRKPNGRVRLCIDPSSLNKAIRREHHPMNNFDDIVTRLHGSQYFTTLDANMGFDQIRLSDESSMYTCFSTVFGRYRHLRMPMGISSAPEIYQRAMEEIFADIEGVEILMDDILVHGPTLAIHNQRLESVLKRARQMKLKLNRQKTKVAQPEVGYVGHILSREGLKPSAKRVEATVKMKEPENHSELETALGMIAYVSKFIPHLSELNAPLRELKTKEEWCWGPVEKAAYQKIKDALSSAPVLKYYDASKPILLSVDASRKGLGAAVIQDGGVVAYASRALSPTEQRYTQIELEMLAVVFGSTRFHQLIYGKSDVTTESDHKPLESLSPNRCMLCP